MKTKSKSDFTLKRLVLVTTVPQTFTSILKGQPSYLSRYFEVILITSPGPEVDTLRKENVPIYFVPMTRGISVVSDIISTCRMIRILLQLKPDIVHSYTPKAGLVTMLAGYVCRVPFRIHTFTGLIWPTSSGILKKVLKFIDSVICFCATSIIPESKGVLNDLKFGGITNKPLSLIGYGNIAGVDIKYFSPFDIEVERKADEIRNGFGISPSDFVFIFVGRLHKEKGVNELLSAFVRLPSDCHLFVLGEVDQQCPISNVSLSLLGSHRRIHWLGFQDDIRPALQVADVFVLPSYREGFPNVLLQSAAMGLPAVATNISGCNEFISPGLNGWLIPVKDEEAIFQALYYAKNLSKSKLLSMGMAGREMARMRFELNDHLERVHQFYSSILSR